MGSAYYATTSHLAGCHVTAITLSASWILSRLTITDELANAPSSSQPLPCSPPLRWLVITDALYLCFRHLTPNHQPNTYCMNHACWTRLHNKYYNNSCSRCFSYQQRSYPTAPILPSFVLPFGSPYCYLVFCFLLLLCSGCKGRGTPLPTRSASPSLVNTMGV